MIYVMVKLQCDVHLGTHLLKATGLKMNEFNSHWEIRRGLVGALHLSIPYKKKTAFVLLI